uniref:Multidrug efflux pump subunit AcrB n=1 Tax=Candidatus Kentrum sp. DK TaxID=2126562 RepID=A0A450SM04_9GAMM|nr:MAG: Multidrug efflux pump subunit AcrB [Candidatus Kentron sp. DK]
MIAWFVRNSVAANLLMGLILVLGVQALFSRLPLEVFPDIDLDIITVSVLLRGATPVEVEEGIVIRIEEAISDLDGIKRLLSSAAEGRAEIRIEIERGTDPRALLDDIKTRVDAIDTFPADAERPVYTIPQRRLGVISVVISADLPEGRLRELGERVRDDLRTLPGAGYVTLLGARPFEIAIAVSGHTLERFGLGFDDIVEAVQNASRDYPAGSLKSSRGEILLRTRGQAYTGAEFAGITVVRRPDGSRLTLGDLADITDGFTEDPLSARFNGRPAVVLRVYRQADQGAVSLNRAVRDYLAKLRQHSPPGVTIDTWFDTSREIAIWLDILLTNAAWGGAIILLILTLLLRPSVAMLVFLGIPISFMGTLAVMPLFGLTVNVISLFAFIVVLGIVVDDAIVTGENIYTHLRRGKDPALAAIDGTHEISVPVTLGVLTTISAFAPLLLMTGERGVTFGQVAMVVILVLLFSLTQSKLILPAHMKHLRVPRPDTDPDGGAGAIGNGIETNQIGQCKATLASRFAKMQDRIADALEHGIRHYYRPLLVRALANRFLTLSLFVGTSFVVISFVLGGHYKFVFFPEVEGEITWASLAMPAGTPAHVMDRHMARITAVAHQLQAKYTDPATGKSAIRNILRADGWSFLIDVADTGPNKGEVLLELLPPTERPIPITNAEIIREWRRATGPIPGAKELHFRFDEQQVGEAIDIQLAGSDFGHLTAAAAAVKARLGQYPGVFDIRDNLDADREEITLTLRPEARLLGITTADLGEQVRRAFFGAEAQRIQRGRDDVRVMVRYPLVERRALTDLLRIKIRTRAGDQIPLGAVAELAPGHGFSTIARVDRHRAVNVTADVDRKNIDINRVVTDMLPFLAELDHRYPGVRYTLEGEQRQQRESFGNLAIGVILVFFVIYALLAIPLRSYLQPLIVMGVIPFGIVGALLGHMIMGLDLSMMSLMGLLALAGVVVNDSLVLVDYINRRRREGIAIPEAVRIAGVARFRPILLTSLTTFAGLMPLIFEDSIQAQYLIPMAVSLGFGILYATLLTLFLVPIGYTLLADLQGLFLPEKRQEEQRR